MQSILNASPGQSPPASYDWENPGDVATKVVTSTWIAKDATRAKQFNSTGAYNPNQAAGIGKGSWRRASLINMPEVTSDRAWRCIYDPVRDKILIPSLLKCIAVYDPITNTNRTPCSSSAGAQWPITYVGGNVNHCDWSLLGGYIVNDLLYIVDTGIQEALTGVTSYVNNLVAINLTTFFSWVNSGTMVGTRERDGRPPGGHVHLGATSS